MLALLLYAAHDLRHELARHESHRAREKGVARARYHYRLPREESAIARDGNVARGHCAAVEELRPAHPRRRDEARLRRPRAEHGDAHARPLALVRERL